MNLSLIPYYHAYQVLWNQFIASAENSSFLFDRNFMDYHADRFKDHSVMLFEGQELIAVLPANESDNLIYSHQGLTYGGLVFKKMSEISDDFFEKCLSCIFKYYHEKGFKSLIYKEMPFFYQTFKINLDRLKPIQLFQKDIGAVIDLRGDFRFSYLRKRSIKKALNNSLLSIQNFENQLIELEKFWNELLIPNLKNKYNLRPTHTLEEITLLANRFPHNIKLYSVYCQKEMVAGTLVFENKKVAHCQYIASNSLGKSLKASDLLFNFLITQHYKDFRYFSFGISNWHGTSTINHNLLAWKLSWGAQVCEHLHFKLEI